MPKHRLGGERFAPGSLSEPGDNGRRNQEEATWDAGLAKKKRANPDGDARQRLPLPVEGTVGIISHIAVTVGSEECHLRINTLILWAAQTFRNWRMHGGGVPSISLLDCL